MAATVEIVRLTGSGPTATTITSIDTTANAADAHGTDPTSYPIRIPGAGYNYSYWVVTRLNCTVSPSSIINNIKWYTNGVSGLGTGASCKVATAWSYHYGYGTIGVTGIPLALSSYDTLNQTPADIFGYTSAGPLSVSGSLSSPSTGQFGNYVVYQMALDSTATSGYILDTHLTWVYDEV